MKWIGSSVLIVLIALVPGAPLAEEAFVDLEELLTDPALEEEGESVVLELLEELVRDPIDLNRARWEDLAALPWITPAQAKAIVSFRRKYGYFSRIGELLQAPGVDEELLTAIAPFVTVPPWPKEPPPRPVDIRVRTRMVDRHPHREGYLEGSFSPTRYSIYNRLSVKVDRRLVASFLTERDPGEASLGDHVSGTMRIAGGEWAGPLEAVDEVVAGDYQLHFARGLVFGPGYAVLKGRELVASLDRRERGVISYASADESRLFRGFAMSVGHPYRAVVFLSLARRDATLSEEGMSVRSLYRSGLHRTATERAKEGRLEERLIGARLRWPVRDEIVLGATGYRAEYDPRLDPPREGGRYYSLRGSRNEVAGADIVWDIGDLAVFGEHAWCLGSGRAWLAGASYSFGTTETAAIVREYDWDFYNDYGFALSDLGGEVRNERGALFGLRHRMGRTTIWFHYDIFEHPWRRYAEEMPTRGHEVWLEAEQRVGEGLALSIRRRSKAREARQEVTSEATSEALDLLSDRNATRLELKSLAGELVESRLRAEWVETRVEELGRAEDGRLILWGTTFRAFDELRMETRWMWFATDSYDSRIYEYENDLPGVMRNMALWGKGRRWYLLVRQRFGRQLNLTLKYARTEREGSVSRGSGVEERRGRTEHEYGVALDLVW